MQRPLLCYQDTLEIVHEGRVYYLNVLEAQPSNAISLTDTDIKISFAPALDVKDEKNSSIEPENLVEKNDLQTGSFQKVFSYSRKYTACLFRQGYESKLRTVPKLVRIAISTLIISRKLVPIASKLLHENMCFARNIACAKCGAVVEKNSLSQHEEETHTTVKTFTKQLNLGGNL